jgi:uncharacterized coiled-coil DUF342 family protein
MIRLKQLEIMGFRGARELVSVELTPDCRSIAIFGDNATGKSSLSDAVEWFYKGHVDHLWKEFCKESALRNILLDEKESSFVTLTFNESSLNSTKTLSPALKASQSNSSSDFQTYIEQVDSGQERITLKNADLLSFILSSKTDKRQELARIIGYEALDEFRATLQRVISQLDSNSDLITARRNLPEYRKDILKLVGRSLIEESDLYVAGQEISASVGVIAAISDDATYTGAIGAIKAQIGQQDKATRKLQLSRLKQDCESLVSETEQVKSVYQDFKLAYNDLLQSGENLRQIKLEEFLSSGRSAIEEGLVESGSCPLCLQNVDWDALKHQLSVRIAKLQESKRKFSATLLKKAAVESHLSTAHHKAEAVRALATSLGRANEFLESVRNYKDITESMKATVSGRFDKFDAVPEGIELESGSLMMQLSDELQRLDLLIKELELSTEEQQRINKIGDLESLRTAFQKQKNAARTKDVFEKQIRTLSEIRNKFTVLQSSTMQRALDQMSGNIGEYYLSMHPTEEVDKVRLSVLPDGGVEFEYAFHGKAVYPPLKYLSESHLNSLGIAAFLSSAKLFNKRNGFFVLDDVVTSLDSNHRLRLLRLLDEKFADWQTVVLTHEPMWFELVKKEFRPRGWIISELEPIPGGIRLKAAPRDAKEMVANKRQTGTLVPNDLRNLLEKILKEVCSALEVRVAFRYNDQNERRMPGELLSELRATLGKKSPGTKDNPVLLKLETSNLISTIGSHDSGPILSAGDMEVCRQDILAFDSLFFCEKCETYLSVERFVNHERKVFCKCGHQRIEWKK